MPERAGSLVIGYFAGCFLTAAIVARAAKGRNIREIGTGNPGMANVMANIGKKAGVIVLLGDILKTVLGMGMAWALFGASLGRNAFLWSGLGCVLGHNFPFWCKGKGGKGVTVTCSWLIVLMPIWGSLSCILGGLLTLQTGYLPLGAVVIPATAIPFAIWKLGKEGFLLIVLGELIMISRHYRGIGRILRGEEERKLRRRNQNKTERRKL